MGNEIGIYALLAVAAFFAGAMNSIAGGGTLLTFPALTAVVSADIANATSTLALLPGSLSGAWGYRKEVVEKRHWVMLLLAPSLVGGVIGALLVVLFPAQFTLLIPWLILTAAILFTIQPFVSKRLNSNNQSGQRTKSSMVGVILFQLVVAIYGGYFGAGIGILMLASLGMLAIGTIHQMNGVKTVLASTINLATVAVFLMKPGMIHWPYAAIMAIAAIVGGYLGARVARKMPVKVVRVSIIVIAFGLAIYYFLK